MDVLNLKLEMENGCFEFERREEEEKKCVVLDVDRI